MLYIMTEKGWRIWQPTAVPCGNSNDLQGVYRGERLSVVQSKLEPRIERFCALMREDEFRNWNEPLYGAYGEKL